MRVEFECRMELRGMNWWCCVGLRKVCGRLRREVLASGLFAIRRSSHKILKLGVVTGGPRGDVWVPERVKYF